MCGNRRPFTRRLGSVVELGVAGGGVVVGEPLERTEGISDSAAGQRPNVGRDPIRSCVALSEEEPCWYGGA